MEHCPALRRARTWARCCSRCVRVTFSFLSIPPASPMDRPAGKWPQANWVGAFARGIVACATGKADHYGVRTRGSLLRHISLAPPGACLLGVLMHLSTESTKETRKKEAKKEERN